MIYKSPGDFCILDFCILITLDFIKTCENIMNLYAMKKKKILLTHFHLLFCGSIVLTIISELRYYKWIQFVFILHF